MSPLRTALRAAADAIADALESASQPRALPVDWLPLAACSRYGLTIRQLRRLIASGELPASRSGRRMLLRAADVETWLAGQTVQPRAKGLPVKTTGKAKGDAFDALIERELARGTLHIVKRAGR